MASRDTLRSAVDLIRRANRFLIVPHLHPDGDALGSALGLYHALRLLGKPVVDVVCHDSVPEIYQFLPGTDQIRQELHPKEPYEVAIVCDMSQLNRAGKFEPLIRHSERILQIDHHVKMERFADVQLVNPKAGATAEEVYRLIRALGVPITLEIATCLLTGIVTDTFSFKFPNTTPRTLRIAARLQSAGANLSEINEQVFETRSFSSVKLLGLALSTLKRTDDGKIAWAVIPRSAFEEAGAHEEETEGIVNFVRSVKGVQVAFLLRETKQGKVRVSLRSRGQVNVAQIANHFGGGGHENAAGCTIEGSLEYAESALLREIQRWMASSMSLSQAG